jgi:2-methylisocitrate lyase-like PEP mutase family enzyme
MLTGGATPALPVPELERMGYRIAVFPIESLLVTLHAVRDLARALLRDGSVEAVGDRMASFDEVKDLLGLQEYLSLGDTLSRR